MDRHGHYCLTPHEYYLHRRTKIKTLYARLRELLGTVNKHTQTVHLYAPNGELVESVPISEIMETA